MADGTPRLTPDFHGCIEIDVPIYKAGAFSFYTTYTPLPEFASHDVACPPPTQTPTYYIDVCPKLGLQGEPLPIDSLVVFSVLSKFMGSYPADWDRHLRGVSQRGYNMVHFTPLMLRGKSNSPYSIYDQHRFDNAVFKNGEKDVARLVQKMETEYGLLAMTDVVWNHTANNSQWLEAHPEAGYNVDTAPWLRAPLDLDTALIQFSKDLRKLRLPTCVRTDDDLAKIMAGCREHVLGDCKLWEYYVCDSERDADLIAKAWTAGQSKFPEDGFGEGRVQGIDDVKNWSLKRKADWMVDYALQGGECLGERFRRRMDAIVGAALLSALYGRYDSRSPSGCTASYSEARSTMALILDECNLQWYREYDADAAVMIQQLFDRIRYCRLADHGPKLGEITDDCPLTEPYFTRLPLNDVTKKHNPEALALANNGWVWAADAMRDNAGPKSRAYLRREVIVWDDCVKLRYGDGPEDNPYLWEHMAKYTRLMAKYFHGFRIDNCHSTPIHVAEHMLEQARRVNPNLFIAAELFTGSEEMDFKFCMRLGITVLVREAMQAWSTQELSRLVHRHGGIPIGSFETDEVLDADHEGPAKEVVHIIKRSPVHALFMDCTHDNEPPAQKRNARDTLSSAALVAMCSCAAGSVMGFDEIYPKLIELVHETRLYWSSYSTDRPLEAKAGKGGIGGIKKLLNQIHTQMGKDEYTETFIHHDREYVTVHRVQPQTRKGYFLIAHTAFPGYGNGNGGFGPTSLPGTKARCIGSWTLEVDTSDATKRAVVHDTKLLRGLPAETKELQGVVVESTSDQTVITIPEEFPPGSIALFETWVPSAEHSDGIDQFVTSGARTAFSRVTLTGCNFLLYRCEPEERDHTSNESGMYNIPGHGPLVYAGLQGWWSVLHDIVNDNNLGHPLCQHLRDGQWALDYCLQRLEKAAQTERYSCLDGPARWLRQKFEAIRKLPSFLLPRYFALVIQTAYNAAVDRCIALMSENVRAGQPFLRKLSLVSAQMTGYMNSASLWPEKSCPSMAAGLPHFASDWARCWGRDICISARGLLMCTGRYDDAREHILAFASVLKHGLVPNLLNGGKLPRYNARDSIWWFLQNVQDYTEMVPGGVGLLQDTVKRRFLPYDDTWFPHTDDRAYSQTSSIEDVIQEALQRHASGIDFRGARCWARPGPPDAIRGIQSQGMDRLGDGLRLRRQPVQLRHVDGQDGRKRKGGQQRRSRYSARRRRGRDHRPAVQLPPVGEQASRTRPLPVRGRALRRRPADDQLPGLGSADPGQLRAVLLRPAQRQRRRRVRHQHCHRAPARHLQGPVPVGQRVRGLSAAAQLLHCHDGGARPLRRRSAPCSPWPWPTRCCAGRRASRRSIRPTSTTGPTTSTATTRPTPTRPRAATTTRAPSGSGPSASSCAPSSASTSPAPAPAPTPPPAASRRTSTSRGASPPAALPSTRAPGPASLSSPTRTARFAPTR